MAGWLRFVSIWNRSGLERAAPRPGPAAGCSVPSSPPTFRIETPSALVVMSDQPVSLLSSRLPTATSQRSEKCKKIYQHQVEISASRRTIFCQSPPTHRLPHPPSAPPNAGWENETCTKIDLSSTTRDIWLKKLKTPVLTFRLGCNNI